MKKLFAFYFALFIACSASFAQEKHVKKQSEVSASVDSLHFTSDQIVYDTSKKIMTYTGNVSLVSDKFQFSEAKRAVYNPRRKKLVVYDCKDFSVDDSLIIGNIKKLKNILKYNVGEKTVRLL